MKSTPRQTRKHTCFFLIPAHSHLTAHSVSTICAMLSTMHGSSSSQLYDWTHWDKKRSEPQLPQLCSHGQWGWGVEWGGCFLYHSATVRTLSVTSLAGIPQGAGQLGLPSTCFVRVPGTFASSARLTGRALASSSFTRACEHSRGQVLAPLSALARAKSFGSFH